MPTGDGRHRLHGCAVNDGYRIRCIVGDVDPVCGPINRHSIRHRAGRYRIGLAIFLVISDQSIFADLCHINDAALRIDRKSPGMREAEIFAVDLLITIQHGERRVFVADEERTMAACVGLNEVLGARPATVAR